MTNVIVAYATRTGSTAEIAETIARVLRARGLDVTVSRCAEAAAANQYDAVIIGSPLYLGRWLQEAVHYLESEAAAVADRPIWLFQSGPCGAGSEDEVANTPHRVKKLVQRLNLEEPATFGGRLDPAWAVGPVGRWMAEGELAGDYRDWHRITAWAADKADQLTAPPPGVSPQLADAMGSDLRKTL